jgi:subtilisin family serine protease
MRHRPQGLFANRDTAVAMSTRKTTITVLALLASLLLATGSAAQSLHVSAGTPTRLIVVLKPVERADEQVEAARTLQERYDVQGLLGLKPLGVDGPVPGAAAYLGTVAAGVDVARLMADLEHSPSVLRVEPDVPRRFLAIDPVTGPLDEYFVQQSYYFDIGVVAMWAKGLTGIRATNPVTVAVIDTGVDLDHPDIDSNLVPGFDFAQMDTSPQDESLDSHGSMVAGIIGAEINNDVVSGVARGVAGIGGGDALSGTMGLRIMPLRITDDASCASSVQAIDYARTHGAQVINMSYGGDFCQLESEAVQRAYDAGIALVAGAGNDNSSTPFYPAAYGAGTNDRLVIAVAGVYADGAKAYESNYGTWVDVSAPFQAIWSITKDGGYKSGSGTSFSAPFVSGLIGVLMSNYGWPRDQAIAIVLTSADNLDAVNPTYHGLLGTGRINADRASVIRYVYLPLVVRKF